MLRRSVMTVVAALASLLTTSAAQAVPITFRFSGTITGISDLGNALAGDVVVGDVFTGTYTFESTLVDSAPGPSIGQYASPASQMHLTVGTFDLFSGSTNRITINNNSVFDSLILEAVDFSSAGLQVNIMAVRLHDTTASVFPNDSLPLLPPPLTAFDLDQRTFGIEARRLEGNTANFYISGVVETLTPEPGVLPLFAASVMAIGLWPSRRRRHETPLRAP